MLHPQLYNIDSKGRLRVWRMESDGANYRTISGLDDGQKVTSAWKEAFPKNVGKANATTAEEQALCEVESIYTQKRGEKYYDNVEDASGTKFFEVMLAHKYKDRKKEVDVALSRAGVFCQPKLDGIRMTLSRKGGISRAGKPFFTVQHIMDELKPLFDANPDLILDGELYNHDLKEDFNKISSLIRKTKPTQADIDEAAQLVQYHVYDLPSCEDVFLTRTSILNGYIKDVYPSVKYVKTLLAQSQEDLDEFYAQWIEEGYEGQMIRFNVPYEGGRSTALLKRKEFFDEEFPLVRVEEGQGNWAGYAKRCFIRLPNGEISKAGIKGNQAFTSELLKNWKQYSEVTVRYPNKTPDGVPRFPIAVDFHIGKRSD